MHTPKRVRGAAYPVPPRRHHRRSGGPRKLGPRMPAVREVSAGGVCVRVEDGVPYVAVILRRSRSGRLEMCLPKGHVEEGESPAEAAIREVEEETGARGRVIYQLGTVDYWFSGVSARIHKLVHHFLMDYRGGELTADNDPDQEAEAAQWIPLLEAPKLLCYPNERRVASRAISLLYPASVAISKSR